MSTRDIPVVMTLSGNDPSGGAGILADIEALISHGCHAAPVITSLTVQDTQDVMAYSPVNITLIIEQARAILEDMPVSAFKIGLLVSVDVVEAIHTLLKDYPDIPVILDPILTSGRGTELADTDVIDAMLNLLVPLSTVITPNTHEARVLAPEADSLDACAMALLDREANYVLITGTHENTPHVLNHLYSGNRLLETFTWDRLPHSYHGSGCTLAASIAGLFAQGLEPFMAIHEAQEYTWEALRNGYRPGMGQYIPDRMFWANTDEE